jgi:hypothetical protein
MPSTTESVVIEERDDPARRQIVVTMPARAEYLRTARLLAADAGARAGMSVIEIDELRIAVDELLYALLDGVPSTVEVELRYLIGPEVVDVIGCLAAGPPDVELELTGLARTVVEATTDEFGLIARDGRREFVLRKSHGA